MTRRTLHITQKHKVYDGYIYIRWLAEPKHIHFIQSAHLCKTYPISASIPTPEPPSS